MVHRLDKPQVTQVASLMLQELKDRCEENEVTLTCTSKLTDAVVDSGYSATYGARPLRRAVQRLCEDAVAEAMLDGFCGPGDKLELDAGSNTNPIALKNGKGKKRVFEASAAQGIEEDAGYGAAANVAVETSPMSDIRINKPASLP